MIRIMSPQNAHGAHCRIKFDAGQFLKHHSAGSSVEKAVTLPEGSCPCPGQCGSGKVMEEVSTGMLVQGRISVHRKNHKVFS